ncbi:3-keto-disaccharide hydrolase [Pelagicoccus mobilis]|uniref:DUF1080 domain-containing protein n=1 Tax=Pelagicoccus mobilis TaxID=415221 RepID=A0A934S374_9BACT|nr:DUF1080 domain-containing protein [Pelagicoccus mobilis]MBK1878982.1 DUF1080 domain-containing protein [Pelagicoccus mobilis]
MKLRNLLTAALALLASASCIEAAGTKKLFNGKNLDGFYVEDGTATYEVRDGAIVGRTVLGSPNTFLTTEKRYGDFELTFEVKVDDRLNSGVQIRSWSRTEPEGKFKEGRFHGPQVEIEAGPGQAGFIYGEAMGGSWLSDAPKSEDKSVNTHDYFKNGEWNKFKIIAKGPRIQTFINGHKVEDLVDKKAYKTHPEGHIGLQVHSISKKKLGDAEFLEVSWRKLKIKEL